MRKLLVPVLLSAFAAAVVLAGCATPATPGSPGTSGPTSSSAPTGGVSTSPSAPGSEPGSMAAVTVTRTGGIAGVRQTLAVSADGSWVYTDGKSGATQRGTLTAGQRAVVAQLLSNPALLSQLSQRTTAAVCNDGFVYTIAMGSEHFGFTDCGGDGLPKQLIAALSEATPF